MNDKLALIRSITNGHQRSLQWVVDILNGNERTPFDEPASIDEEFIRTVLVELAASMRAFDEYLNAAIHKVPL